MGTQNADLNKALLASGLGASVIGRDLIRRPVAEGGVGWRDGIVAGKLIAGRVDVMRVRLNVGSCCVKEEVQGGAGAGGNWG